MTASSSFASARERLGSGTRHRLRQVEQVARFLAAEILRAEQLLHADDLRALSGRLADAPFSLRQVLVGVLRAGHLDQAHAEFGALHSLILTCSGCYHRVIHAGSASCHSPVTGLSWTACGAHRQCRRSHSAGTVRLRSRRRFQARGRRSDLRLLPPTRGGERPAALRGVRQNVHRQADVHRLHLGAREPEAAGPLPRDQPQAGVRRRHGGRSAAPCRRWQGHRVDRFRLARHRGGAGAARARTRVPHGDGRDAGDPGHPPQRHPAADPRHQSRRARHGGEVVPRERGHALRSRDAAAALPEVFGARQQPRLVHAQPAGDPQCHPPAVSRVVPADRLQPAPAAPFSGAHFRAAVCRTAQPQHSRACDGGHQPHRCGD